MHTVKDLIKNRPEPYVLDAGLSTQDASRFMREHHIGAAPVVKDGELVGFCSERDLVYRVVAEKREPAETTVEEIMSRDVVCKGVDSTMRECEDVMRLHHVRHLPIVDGKKVVACISLRDVLQGELEDSESDVGLLSDYIRGG